MFQRRLLTAIVFALYGLGLRFTSGLALFALLIIVGCVPGYRISSIYLPHEEMPRYESIGVSILISLTLCLLVIVYLLVLHISLSSTYVVAAVGACVLVVGVLELLLKLYDPTV